LNTLEPEPHKSKMLISIHWLMKYFDHFSDMKNLIFHIAKGTVCKTNWTWNCL